MAIRYHDEHLFESDIKETLKKIPKPTREILFFWNIKLEFNHHSKTWSNILSKGFLIAFGIKTA